MSTHSVSRLFIAIALGVLGFAQASAICNASEVLVADRLTNSVYRYDSTGGFLSVLINDNVNLNQPDGLAVSPDHTKLYVASSQNNQIVAYDYNYAAGTAANPTVFATAAQGLAFPNAMSFSQDGTKLYVANLGGGGITQLNAAGGNAGAPIGGGTSFAFSGLAFAPGGELLAGGFDGNTVAKSNVAITATSDFVGPSAALAGAAGVMVNGNDLYVAGLFTGFVQKFNATTGALDPSFNVSGLAFPQGVLLAPDGNSLLVGVLGFVAGSGNIARYGFDGTSLGVFAASQINPALGFTEATTMLVVPEPASWGLAAIALAALGFIARRRARR